jgi:hypothetical protein
MLKQCPRCRLCVELDAPACCRNCGAEFVDAIDDSVPREIFEDTPTTKRPTLLGE